MGDIFCQRISVHFGDNSMVLIFLLAKMVHHFDRRILKNACIPRIKSTWLLCMMYSIHCWILFARFLLRIFASMASVILAYHFPFFLGGGHILLVLVY